MSYRCTTLTISPEFFEKHSRCVTVEPDDSVFRGTISSGHPMDFSKNADNYRQKCACILLRDVNQFVSEDMQKFIEESCGRDLRINVVKNKVVASMLRENKNDFRSNVTGGGVARRTAITKEQESAAISALNALSCDFGGVDVLLNDGEPMVLEVNSNMHFVSTFNCTGINVAESIAEYIVSEIYG